MLNIVHNGKEDRTYANIMSIAPMPKGMQCPPAINTPMCYDTTEHDDMVFSLLPDFMQEDIKKSDEWLQRISQESTKWTKPQQASPFDDGADDLDDLFNTSKEKFPF
jgi:hypothetical protein